MRTTLPAGQRQRARSCAVLAATAPSLRGRRHFFVKKRRQHLLDQGARNGYHFAEASFDHEYIYTGQFGTLQGRIAHTAAALRGRPD
jgi:hypothetical protein